jgi:hypothetical protein
MRPRTIQNQKSFSNFQLTHSTKQQLGERTLSLVTVLKKKKIRDDNGFENLLNWNRLVRKKNLICKTKKKTIFFCKLLPQLTSGNTTTKAK